MIITRRTHIFFTSARIIFDDAILSDAIRTHRYSYIAGISFNKLSFPKEVKVKSKKTIHIALSPFIDDVLARFNDTSRNEVRKTFALSNMRVVTNDANVDEVYDVYRDFRKRKGMVVRKKYFLESATLFGAYWGNTLISAVSVYDAHPHLRVQNIFSCDPAGDPELRKYIGYASRRLIYEVCKYGCERGHVLLDLAGINLTDPGKEGIARFKQSFGGVVADEYTYTYKSSFLRLVNMFTN